MIIQQYKSKFAFSSLFLQNDTVCVNYGPPTARTFRPPKKVVIKWMVKFVINRRNEMNFDIHRKK